MEKQFVPYFVVSKLIELGLTDFTPFAYYASFYDTSDNVKLYKEYSDEFQDFDIVVPAPLWQQAFDWFREKYGLICEPKKYIDWYFNIEKIIEGKAETDLVENTLTFPIYESARLACLEKLIELITPQLEDK